jgi:hypothetical protein
VAEGGEGEQIYVIRTARVREAIDVLWSRDTHQFFIAYLHLRRRAGEMGTTENLRPRWAELSATLATPGGPHGKPHLRPFWKGARSAGQQWLGQNLAGSYSPASIRGVPAKVIETTADGGYTLRERHWELAMEHFLLGKRMNAVALAAFLFRDYGILDTLPPGASDLVALFRAEYGYSRVDEVEFQHLYDEEWHGDPGDWAEPWTSSATP